MAENAWGVSPFTLDFIKKLEGYTPKPKWDYKQYSKGFGTKWEPGQPLGTRADHEAALAGEAGKVNSWLDQNVTVPLDDNKRAALSSFGYNLGVDDLERLKPDINAGAWDRVAARLPSWNKAGGQVNEGLINRRAAEVEMLTGRRPTLADTMMAGMSGSGGMPQQGQPGAMPPEALVAPSGRYSKLADALLASAAGAKPTGWGSALNAFGDAALGYSLAGKEDKAQKDYSSKLSQMLSGAKTPEDMTQTLIGSGDEGLRNMGVQSKIQEAQAQRKAAAPLRGKERFLVTPNGVMDVETNQIVPGTAKEVQPKQPKIHEVNGRLIQEQPDGTLKPVYESPQKPTQLTAADRKEIIESDQAAQAGKSAVIGLKKAIDLNDKAYSGPLAETRGYIASLFGSEGGKATEDVGNIITSQALDQLKAVFGGMPTEGERNILLQIQGSTNQAPAVRKGIWDRAIDMAERRIDFNERQSGAIRSGDYYQPGYSPVTPDAAPAQTQPPAAAQTGGAPKQIQSQQEYQALPPGTQYIAPDGSTRTKQ